MDKHKSGYAKRSQNKADRVGHNEKLSRGLSRLLRHGAPEENVTIHSGGYIDIDEILRLKQFKEYSVDDIKSVVENNDKQRFTIKTDENSGKLQICANQGHSFEVEDAQLDVIIDPADYPTVIHGTYSKCLEGIKKTGGLSKMNRVHIHFAPGVLGSDGVISGMRKSAEIYVYVDIAKAMSDGIKFYKSRNNVVLTPGNDKGVLESKYFQKVVNVKTNEILKII